MMIRIAILNKHIWIFLAFLFGCFYSSTAQGPVKVILDTDIGPDYDDVGAMAVLHSLADKNEAEILATISCNNHYLTGPTLEVLNTYFKRSELVIGVPKSLALSMGAAQKWPQAILAKYPHKHQSNDAFADAVKVYRKLLANAADASITIIAVGFLTNLSDLLKSTPDGISSLSGKELVKRKVKKLVTMAGRFPTGREFNIYKDYVSAAFVVSSWPSKIYFSGWEIGNKIHTGLKILKNTELQDSPIKDVYSICMPLAASDSSGRMSWDQTAVLAGVRGAGPYFNLVPGKMVILKNGSNKWIDDPNGKQFYYSPKMDSEQLAIVIEDLMMR